MQLATADQSRWLKKYTLDEFAELVYRHREHAAILHTGKRVDGFALGTTCRHDEKTVHVAFIAVFRDDAINQFVGMLRRAFPTAERISYIRRHKLQFTDIAALPRMLRLTQSKRK